MVIHNLILEFFDQIEYTGIYSFKIYFSRILLFSWFDSNVCTILRHLSLIAWFICELIHFIMSCPFLKGLLSNLQSLIQEQWWVFGILVWTDTCFWNEEPNSSSKSGQLVFKLYFASNQYVLNRMLYNSFCDYKQSKRYRFCLRSWDDILEYKEPLCFCLRSWDIKGF